MGLLDDLLGGLAGQAMGAGVPQQRQPTQAGAGGADMSRILMALMPIVLAMLSNRGQQQTGGAPNQAGYGPSAGGGGLGDILGQVLGGATGGRGGMGGLGGLLEQLQRTGFGDQAGSWVARGANKPIPPDAMGQVFGRDGIEKIARQAGISVDDASRGLSQLLPEVVDRVTPNGEAPDFDSLSASVEDLARRIGVR